MVSENSIMWAISNNIDNAVNTHSEYFEQYCLSVAKALAWVLEIPTEDIDWEYDKRMSEKYPD